MLLAVLPAILPQSSAHAASGYLADEIGNTEINVDVDDDVAIVLWVADVAELAAYNCKITVSGPGTLTGQSAHGEWFADGHTVFGGLTSSPADYNTAMLMSPLGITGSGDIVRFTLHADEEGVVAVNVDSGFFLANSNAAKISLLIPSTLYITIGEGEGLFSGGESEPEDMSEEKAPLELDDPLGTCRLTVKSKIGSQEIDSVEITGEHGGTTEYYRDLEIEIIVTLTAPFNIIDAYHFFHHWDIAGIDFPPGENEVEFELEEDTTATAVYHDVRARLTVKSKLHSQEIDGVQIAGEHGGTTEYCLDLEKRTIVTLAAPITILDNVRVFHHWEISGLEVPLGENEVQFDLQDDVTATAVYYDNRVIWVGHDTAGERVGTFDSPYDEIQDAINVVPEQSADHIIIVKNGTYSPNIDFLHPRSDGTLVLRSHQGPTDCIIESGQFDAGFWFENGEGNSSVVHGFTIKYGFAGVICWDNSAGTGSSPTLSRNIIKEVTGPGISCTLSHPIIWANTIQSSYGNYGHAIECQGASPLVAGNSLLSNSGYGVDCGDDGDAQSPSEPVIVGNTIDANSGGIHAVSEFGTDILISDNYIRNNTTSGGIRWKSESSSASLLTISDNIITGNFSSSDGGGISCDYSDASEPTLQTITITGSTVDDNELDGGNGGGIACTTPYNGMLRLVIADSSISFNELGGADSYGGGGYFSRCNLSISGCAITKNKIHNEADYGGAPGIYIEEGSVDGLIGNDIIENTCEGHVGGLHLYFVGGDEVLVKANKILGNTAEYGAGLRIDGSGATPEFRLINNLIAENIGKTTDNPPFGCGAAIYYATGIMVNNTIANNDSDDRDSTLGGGLYVSGASTWKLINSIVWGNLKDESDGPTVNRNQIGRGHSSTLTFTPLPG